MAGEGKLNNSSDYFFNQNNVNQPAFFMMSQLVESLTLSH